MVVLSVKDLTKRFNRFTAVNKISLNLDSGEILGLLGPNGAGKTTTIQMLLGAMTPTSGLIKYFNKDFDESREEIMNQVNFASTYTSMPNNLKVSEVLDIFSWFYNIINRKKRVKEIVSTFRLDNIYNKRILDLSAGQRTRVTLAKAMINYPKVLLLDEPTASLDPEVTEYIHHFLINQKRQYQMSIILTSHNMAEVEKLCDRVIFINHGKIIANNTPDKLAKTIKISHIELHISDGLKRLINICKKTKLQYHIDIRSIIIDINEDEIPFLLNTIAENKIKYDEISIQKPSLEDYFLQMSKK